mmetsp:Transcript_3995/g.9367  ORF Transcript_3995/g.9367 Transcript_3995/m.9367 type:complete len:205 (+) Transcript_3995:1777-2391(+)
MTPNAAISSVLVDMVRCTTLIGLVHPLPALVPVPSFSFRLAGTIAHPGPLAANPVRPVKDKGQRDLQSIAKSPKVRSAGFRGIFIVIVVIIRRCSAGKITTTGCGPWSLPAASSVATLIYVIVVSHAPVDCLSTSIDSTTWCCSMRRDRHRPLSLCSAFKTTKGERYWNLPNLLLGTTSANDPRQPIRPTALGHLLQHGPQRLG